MNIGLENHITKRNKITFMRLWIFIVLFVLSATSGLTQGVKGYPTLTQNDDVSLFYMKHSLSNNMVVYEPRFDKLGNLDLDNPVNIYWVMKDDNNAILPLNAIEQKFAYGIEIEESKRIGFDLQFTIISFPQRPVFLKQKAPFEVESYMRIYDKLTPLDHIFANTRKLGFLIIVDSADLIGRNGSNTIKERVMN